MLEIRFVGHCIVTEAVQLLLQPEPSELYIQNCDGSASRGLDKFTKLIKAGKNPYPPFVLQPPFHQLIQFPDTQ
jgi:hypothetical protein